MPIENGENLIDKDGTLPLYLDEAQETDASYLFFDSNTDSTKENIPTKKQQSILSAITKNLTKVREGFNHFMINPETHISMLLKGSELADKNLISSLYRIKDEDIKATRYVLTSEDYDAKTKLMARDLLCHDSCDLSIDNRIDILGIWVKDAYQEHSIASEVAEKFYDLLFNLSTAAYSANQIVYKASNAQEIFVFAKKLIDIFDKAVSTSSSIAQEFYTDLRSTLISLDIENLDIQDLEELWDEFLQYLEDKTLDISDSKIFEEDASPSKEMGSTQTDKDESDNRLDVSIPEKPNDELVSNTLKTSGVEADTIIFKETSCRDFEDLVKELSGEDTALAKRIERTYASFREAFEGSSKIYSISLKEDFNESKGVEESKGSEENIEKESIDKNINFWDREDVLSWAGHFGQKAAVENKETGLYELNLDCLPEVIAVIQQANFIFCKQILRIPQVLSLIMFFDENIGEKGMLQRVRTGEGKSTIVSCLIAIQCLLGNKVDFVTSSEVLVERDLAQRSDFLAMFGIKSGHNCDKKDKSSYRQADVVYGTTLTFQFDLLRDAMGKHIRGLRSYDIVIVDEVDSMCIDESSKLALVSSPIPGICYLWPIYSAIWFKLVMLEKQVCKIDDTTYYIDGPFEVINNKIIIKPYIDSTESPQENSSPNQVIVKDEERISTISDKDYFIQKNLEFFLAEKLPGMEFPEYLNDFTLMQKVNWVDSAMRHAGLKKNIHYYLIIDDKGQVIAAPIDYENTGIIHGQTSWGDGGHQATQLKEGIKLTPESLITSFISNTAFFQKYKKIYGVTGTLGSKDSINLLMELYKVTTTFIPTFKTSLFQEEAGKVVNSQIEHLSTLVETIKEKGSKAAVLVICKTIEFAHRVYALLKNEPSLKSKLYCRADESEKEVLEAEVEVGDVIIATNLAGRGSDIKTSLGVEKAGGLFVLLTFLPANKRVEEQAFGRTARQGNQGSAQIVSSLRDLPQSLQSALKTGNIDNINQNILSDIKKEGREIKALKTLRDELEDERLLIHKWFASFIIEQEDALFTTFCALRSELSKVHKSSAKLSQIEESFGIFVKQLKEERDSRYELKAFKDELWNKGYKIHNCGSHFDSIYRAVSHQLEYKLSSKQLQTLIFHSVFKKLEINSLDFEEKIVKVIDYFNDISDTELVKLIGQILKCPIILVTDEQISADKALLLTLFTDKFGRKFYCSLDLRDSFSEKLIDLNHLDLDLDIRFADYCDSIRDKLAQNQAKTMNSAIKEFTERKFENFASYTRKNYGEGHVIVDNPFYLVVEANNSFCTGSSSSIGLMEYAKAKDSYYNFSAYYNCAYMKVCNGAWKSRDERKINSAYMHEATGDLLTAKNQIENFINPSIEVISLLSLSSISATSEQLINKQVKDRVAALKVVVSHINTVVEKVRNCNPKNYIDISNFKPLHEILSDTDPLEIEELLSLGMPAVFDVKEKSLPVDFFSAIALTLLGGIQICLGVLATCCGHVNLGASIVMGGIGDFVKAIKVLDGEPFNWDHYAREKGIEIAVQVALKGIDATGQRIGLIERVTPEKLNLIKAMPKLGEEVLKRIVVDKALDLTQNAILGKGINNLGKSFSEAAEERIEQYFNDPDTKEKIHALLSMDKVKGGQTNNAFILQNLVRKAANFKASALQTILVSSANHITANASSNTATRFAVGALIGGASAAVQIKQINEHMDDLISFISKEVNQRYNATASGPETYLKHVLRYNCTNWEVKEMIDALEAGGIIQNGKVIIPISWDIDDHLGLPEYLQRHSKNIKERLKGYSYVIQSEDAKRQSAEFIDQLKGSLINSTQGLISGSFKSSVADPMIKLACKDLYNKIRESAGQVFKNMLQGKSSQVQEEREWQKQYQEALVLAEEARENQQQRALTTSSHNDSSNDGPGSDDVSSSTIEDKASLLEGKEEKATIFNAVDYFGVGNLANVPNYSTLEELIAAKPYGFDNSMVPLLSDLRNSSLDFVPYQVQAEKSNDFRISFTAEAEASMEGEMSKNIAIPVLETLAIKYSRKVATGFGKLVVKHGIKVIPGIGVGVSIAVAVSEVYDIYNRLMETSIQKQKIAAKEVMATSARKTIDPDRCEYFRGLSNDQLAQALADLNLLALVPPILQKASLNVIGIYQHTNMKTINDTYSAVCQDNRFEAEVHYRDGKIFDPKGKPPGSTKGTSRVDLRTTEPINELTDQKATYNYKTGKAPITQAEIDRHKNTLRNDYLLELRSGEAAPKEKYNPNKHNN